MKKLNINDYLNQVDQNFSGMTGRNDWDDLSGIRNVNQDLYFSGANGTVTGELPAASTPSPYRVTIVNSTGGTLTAVMFGRNRYAGSTNYGSAAGLVLTTGIGDVTYYELLQQSADQPFETSLIRINSSNTSQVTEILNVTARDANGKTCTDPVAPLDYFASVQYQSTIIDVPYKITIDGNAYITTDILPNTTVKYTFFPASKVNTTRALPGYNGNPLKDYAAPAVPILSTSRPASYPANRSLEM